MLRTGSARLEAFVGWGTKGVLIGLLEEWSVNGGPAAGLPRVRELDSPGPAAGLAGKHGW